MIRKLVHHVHYGNLTQDELARVLMCGISHENLFTITSSTNYQYYHNF